MHIPLDTYIQRESRCKDVVLALIKCHEETPKWKQLFGACDRAEAIMKKCVMFKEVLLKMLMGLCFRCTKAERLELEKKHSEAVKEAHKKRRADMAKWHAEGKTWQQVYEEKLRWGFAVIANQ